MKCCQYTKCCKINGYSKRRVNWLVLLFCDDKNECKDPWGRLVRYNSFKLKQYPCMCYSKMIYSIVQRPNERATRTAGGGRDTDSFVSVQIGDAWSNRLRSGMAAATEKSAKSNALPAKCTEEKLHRRSSTCEANQRGRQGGYKASDVC